MIQPPPDESLCAAELSGDIERALEKLTERERLVLIWYFGLGGDEPMTLKDIGKRLKLTRERIRQIREKALQWMRHKSRGGRALFEHLRSL